jgi:prepilin-type N-terminal cleavage/methylation domain-containing protein
MKKMMSIKKERRRRKMKKMMRKEEGFTLVELLIVVIILGILAAVAIPQFGSSTDDAKLSTLTSNLSSLRNAMELYKQEHDNVYPGAVSEADGTTATVAGTCPQAFVFQLTRYTDIAGIASVDYVAGKKGPYVKKGMPENPFNKLDTVVCDFTVNDITTQATPGGSGWIYYALTGKLLANDGSHGSY